ncbi:single-stranded-DNA-specific exonuclease RecJ [Caldanaerobius polysaccharolyticus]|uniref:single-stranded-DNA-specific exonuclease RecJ n=1 Tax=Caldanaerobius polysaccharolyticus TaxID=44256 RepID=UPI00068D0202|nr:single-stranded-DNA-specific exonuclease RecJ [Caldanaerobius polysaccharolyticus]
MLKRKYRWIGCDTLSERSAAMQIAKKRGIQLNVTRDMIKNPFDIKDMDRAVARIKESVRRREKIAVYGDYDVDGITATAIVYKALRALNADVMYYIPDRLDEGYGLNVEAVKYLINCGVKLIITVDCGVTALEEVRYANNNGVDVVITDHHTCGPVLPEACCIVNPKREDDTSGFKYYSGAGIALKLAMALGYSLEDFIQYAMLGTISDIVPLIDENRVIAKLGLEVMNTVKDPGISALVEVSGITGCIRSEDVAFKIGPRLNAAGRMSNPELALKLLLVEDADEAREIAVELNRLNNQRQSVENEIYQQAVDMLKGYPLPDVIVLAKEGWHEGVIGIVASKLVNSYNRPCILISLSGDVGKGSCRSIKYFNIYHALKACEQYIEKYGGHDMAAGLTLRRDNLEKFKEQINFYAKGVLRPEHKVPEVDVDFMLTDEYYDVNLAEELTLLEPYGLGNQKPVFLCKDLKVSEVRNLSNDKHVKLRLLSDRGKEIEAIGFLMGELAKDVKPGDYVDVVCHFDVNRWNDQVNLQLNLIDVGYSKRQMTRFYAEYLSTFKDMLLEDKLLVGDSKKLTVAPTAIDENKVDLLLKEGSCLIIMYSFRQLIGFMKRFSDILEHIGLCFRFIDDDRDNILLINPDYMRLDTSRFRNVILYSGDYYTTHYRNCNVYIVDEPGGKLLYGEDIYDMIPDRSDLEDVYMCIKRFHREISSKDIIKALNKNPLKVDLCVCVLEDLGLIDTAKKSNGVYYKIHKLEKVDLSDSPLYIKLLKIRDNVEDFFTSKNIV